MVLAPRVSFRRLLHSGAVALMLAIAGLAGAGPASADGVTLRRGNLAEPDTLDPQKFFTTYESEVLRDLFMGLLQLDAKGEAVAGGAASWTTSEDGLTMVFKLRADARWSDGQPVTADDYVLGFHRAFDPRTAAPYANFGYVIRNARAVTAGEMPGTELGVRAVDPLTLEISLERPSRTLTWLLGAFPVFFPVPKHVYDVRGEDWVRGDLVGNGPFSLREWVPNGQIHLVRNPHFFDATAVAIDDVYFYPTDDDAAAVKRFRSGELDLNLRYPPGLHAMLKRELPLETGTYPGSWVGYIVMNQTDPRFADPRVRRALSLAIDRETIVKRVLNNGELPAWTLVPPTTPDFTSSKAGDFSGMPMPQRQAEARRLLADAGYGDGNRLTFTYTHRIGEANKRVSLAITEMWKAVGIDVRIEANEVKTHYARLRQQQFEVADGGWQAPPDAEFFLSLGRTDSVEMNFGKWSNAEFDRLTDLGSAERDPARRAVLFAQAEKILLDDTGIIATYIPVQQSLVQTWVKGFELNALNFHPTRWMRIER